MVAGRDKSQGYDPWEEELIRNPCGTVGIRQCGSQFNYRQITNRRTTMAMTMRTAMISQTIPTVITGVLTAIAMLWACKSNGKKKHMKDSSGIWGTTKHHSQNHQQVIDNSETNLIRLTNHGTTCQLIFFLHCDYLVQIHNVGSQS